VYFARLFTTLVEMKRHYCTYFDHVYLDRGLAMIRSLRRVDPDGSISVLCLTPAVHRVLSGLGEPGVTLIVLEEFEQENPDLLAAKESRCLRDYYYTLTASLVCSVLQGARPDDVVTYLDADLMFYSDPGPIYEAMAGASVGLIGHRWHWWTRRLRKYGRFNVGWVSFRADATGTEAARWWRDRCIEWCYGCVDGDLFADQKYLDHIHARFPNVVEITHPGTNVGPWNICREDIRRAANGSIVVGSGFSLIFFHFSGLKEMSPGVWLGSLPSYLGPFSSVVRTDLYEPYIGLLGDIRKELGGLPADPPPVLSVSVPPRLWRRLLAPLIRRGHRWAGHYFQA